MIKYILLGLLFITVIASCKKEEATKESPYYFTAKFNGDKRDLNSNVIAVRETEITGRYNLKINASTGSTHPFIILAVSSFEPITTRTYQSSAVYSPANDHAEVQYWPSVQSFYRSDRVFSVTLTSITPTEIKGTFSGTINQGYVQLTVTEGAFYAKVL